MPYVRASATSGSSLTLTVPNPPATPFAVTNFTWTSGSRIVTTDQSMASVVSIQEVSGTGIAAGSRVQSVDSATQLTLTAPTTAGGSGVTLTFTPAGPSSVFIKAFGVNVRAAAANAAMLRGSIPSTTTNYVFSNSVVASGAGSFFHQFANPILTTVATGAAVTAALLASDGSGVTVGEIVGFCEYEYR